MSSLDDRDEELAAIEAMRAIDLPHPASYAFGLWSTWPKEAAVMLAARKAPCGRFKVTIRDPFDERLRNLRRLGMLDVIGHQPTRESIERGWYIDGFAELVRRELVMLRSSRG